MKLLLDTCSFLWLANGERAFSREVAQVIMAADTELALSAVSAWELAIKHTRGRLPLPEPLARFVPRVRDRYWIAFLPLDEESALHIVTLPALHADPFDRMLVSQAIVHGMTILTPDPLITQYPARTLW